MYASALNAKESTLVLQATRWQFEHGFLPATNCSINLCSETTASLAQVELCREAARPVFASVLRPLAANIFSRSLLSHCETRWAQERRCIARDGGDNTLHKHERRGLHNLQGGFTFY